MRSILATTAKNTGQGAACRRIWTNHPYLKKVTESAILHFHGFLYKDFALTEIALVKAVLAYQEIAKSKNENTQPHYLAAFFNALASSANIQFYSQDTPSLTWDPTEDISFLAFSQKQKICSKQIQLTKPALLKCRKLLILKFLQDADSLQTVCETETARNWLKP